MGDSNLITQHQVGACGGAGDCAVRTTERKHRDQGIAGDETHRCNSHSI